MVDTAETPLTPKQRQLIEALITTNEIRAACKLAHVAEISYYRWIKLPHFTAAYKEAQGKSFDDTLSDLKAKAPHALNTLYRHATASYVKPTASSQVRAAMELLDKSLELGKLEEIQAQINDLYTLISGNDSNGNGHRSYNGYSKEVV